MSRRARPSSPNSMPSSANRGSRHEILQLPSDALPACRSRRDRQERLGVGDVFEQPLRSAEGRRALSRVSRPDGVRRPARLRRRLPQRASPDRLRHDADPGRARRRARAQRQARQGRDPRPRAAAGEQSADHRRRVRHARQRHARPADRRLRARHRRRVSRHGHQPGLFAGAFRRGARPDRAGLDRARAVLLCRQALPVQIREHLAAALSDAASAGVDSLAGLRQHDPLGGEDALHLLPDAEPDRDRGAVLPDVSRGGRQGSAIRPRPTSSPGRTPSTSPTPTRRRCARPSRTSKRWSTCS